MLQDLKVTDVALIEAIELEFGSGFIAVTGETGAGKSVLLGALSILAGNRVSKEAVRQGASSGKVEATLFFEDAQRIDRQLEALELPPTDEGVLLLERSISRGKAGKIRINGATATRSALSALSEHWIDFHGPGEPQRLHSERVQLELLDVYAGLADVLDAYRLDWVEWRKILTEVERLEQAERLDPDEAAFLRQQLAAIDAVKLDQEAIEALERDFNRLDRARELMESASEVARGLDGPRGVSDMVSNLLRRAKALAAIDTEADELVSRLDGLVIEVGDLAGEFRALAEAGDFEPAAAQDIQAKMAAWLELRRRFGPTLDDVRQKRLRLVERLGSQSGVEERVRELRDNAAVVEKRLRKQAEAMTKRRREAAIGLAERVAALLKRLGFKAPRFEIAIATIDALTETGSSSCSYRFAPNPGQELMALNKIASSGESARVMLALKTVLAELDQTPVLVFDEVDANVGGEIGAEVGTELSRLGDGHQVFCITHLPQVAAKGKEHWVVVKHQDEVSTRITIEAIHTSVDARVVELARMLGDRNADSAREHGRRLLGGV